MKSWVHVSVHECSKPMKSGSKSGKFIHLDDLIATICFGFQRLCHMCLGLIGFSCWKPKIHNTHMDFPFTITSLSKYLASIFVCKCGYICVSTWVTVHY